MRSKILKLSLLFGGRIIRNWFLPASKTRRKPKSKGKGEYFEVYSTAHHSHFVPWGRAMIAIQKREDRRRHLRSGEKSFYKFHSVAFPFCSWEGGWFLPPPFFQGPAHFPWQAFLSFGRNPQPIRRSISSSSSSSSIPFFVIASNSGARDIWPAISGGAEFK